MTKLYKQFIGVNFFETQCIIVMLHNWEGKL